MTSYLSHEVRVLQKLKTDNIQPGEHVHNRSVNAGIRGPRLETDHSVHGRPICKGDVCFCVLSLVKHDASQVGRNITRAFWDYYKIVAVIPLEVGGSRKYKYAFNCNKEQNLLPLCLFFRTRQTTNVGSQSLRGTCLAGQSRRR